MPRFAISVSSLNRRMLGRGGREWKSMDGLTLFGLVAVAAMLVTYACERRGASWVLAFAAACLAGSAYGFLQGAWPFGVVEAIWAAVAVHRWWTRQDL